MQAYIPVRSASIVQMSTDSVKGDCVQAEVVAELDAGSIVREVRWNGLGSWLAVSTHDGEVQLWRSDLGGSWSRLTRISGACNGLEQQGDEADMMD